MRRSDVRPRIGRAAGSGRSMTVRKGWKITHVDGTTHQGYRWPLPMPGDWAVVKATNVDRTNTGPCPSRPGDGLCVVREGIVRHVTSGGVRLAQCIGLALEWDDADELGHEADEKIRVAKVTVTGIFDPLALIRSGLVADLTGAYLYGAYLYGANLYGANLSGADLTRASLYSANLTGADLSDADLTHAKMPEGWTR